MEARSGGFQGYDNVNGFLLLRSESLIRQDDGRPCLCFPPSSPGIEGYARMVHGYAHIADHLTSYRYRYRNRIASPVLIMPLLRRFCSQLSAAHLDLSPF